MVDYNLVNPPEMYSEFPQECSELGLQNEPELAH